MDKSNWNLQEWTKYKQNLTKEDCLEHLKKSIMDCYNCYDLSERPQWQLYGHAAIITIIAVMSIVESTLYFILISKHKKLRYRSSIIAIAVVFVNIGLIVTFHLPVLVSAAFGEWKFSFTGCQIFGFLSNDFLLTYWLNMGILALDKLCMTHFSIYPKRSKCFLILLIVASWIAPILLSTITVDEYSIVVFRQNAPTCVPYFPENNKGSILLFSMGVISGLVGGAIPFAIYVWIFFKDYKTLCLKKLAIVSRRDTGTDNSHPPNERIPGYSTFVLIFTVSCLTQMPAGLLVMVRWLSLSTWCGIPHEIHFITIELLCSTSALVPIVLMRERNFRVELKRILLCCSKRPRDVRSENRNRGTITSQQRLQAFDAIYFLPSESRFEHIDGSNNFRIRSGSLPTLSPRKGTNFHKDDSFLAWEETLNSRPKDTHCSSLNLSSSSYGVDEIEIRQI